MHEAKPTEAMLAAQYADIDKFEVQLQRYLSGELEEGEMRTEPLFGMQVPLRVEGVTPRALDPRASWADVAAYDAAAAKLQELFAANHRKFEPVPVAAE